MPVAARAAAAPASVRCESSQPGSQLGVEFEALRDYRNVAKLVEACGTCRRRGVVGAPRGVPNRREHRHQGRSHRQGLQAGS